MSDSPDAGSSLRRFLNQAAQADSVRIEHDIDISVAIEEDRVVFETDDEAVGEGSLGDEVTVRVGSESSGGHWIAEAVWAERDRLEIRGVRTLESGSENLHYWRSSYRVTVPDGVDVELASPDGSDGSPVEPVDLSTDGIGLYAGVDESFDVGERVEISLQVGDEFDGVLPGRVAFSQLADQKDQVRMGIEFSDLEPSTEQALRSTLNTLMLVTAEDLSE